MVKLSDSFLREQEKELVESAPSPEVGMVLATVFNVYRQSVSSTPDALAEAGRCIDDFKKDVTSGSPLPQVDDAWAEELQRYIESIVHPSIGRDRIGIALAYFKSALLVEDMELTMSDLTEAYNQIRYSYNYVVTDPFEL